MNKSKKPVKGYTGYKIPDSERSRILSLFPPKYDKVIAHHVTHEFGVPESLPPDAEYAKLIGYTDSGDGIEALVVEINGSTKRPDNKIYHITLSLDSTKYSPKNSNDIITQKGYLKVNPLLVKVEPKFFRG